MAFIYFRHGLRFIDGVIIGTPRVASRASGRELELSTINAEAVYYY